MPFTWLFSSKALGHLPRRWRNIVTGVIGFLSIALATTCAQAASLSHLMSDPFDTDAMISPNPAAPAARPQDYRAIGPLETKANGFKTNRVYSLAQLGALALANNPDTRSTWAAIRASAAGVGDARSAVLPTLNFSVSTQRSQTTNSSGYAIPLQKTATPNLSLSWLLYDFGQTAANVDAARAALRMARFQHDQAIQQVLQNVTSSYYQVLADHVLIKVSKDSLSTAQNALDMAQARHRAGQATISDVYQSRAALAKAQSDLDTARLTLRQNQGALASAVGLPIDTTIRLPKLESALPPTLTEQVHQLMQQALRENASLQAAQATVDQSQANLDAANRAGLPTITLNAQQGLRLQTNISNTRFNSIGITLRVPLFTGYGETYRRHQAEAKLAQAEAERDATRQSTELAVWQAYYSFQSAITALPSARAQRENAEAALDAVNAQYKVGLATIQELLTAQSNVTSAQVAVAQDVLNAYTAMAKLGSAIGSLGKGVFDLPRQLDPSSHQIQAARSLQQ